MKNGWIKLWRKVKQSSAVQRKPYHLAVWIDLLTEASHQEMEMNFAGEVIQIKPGQLITSRAQIAKRTGVHPSRVQRILADLRIDQLIDQRTSTTSTLISIIKWSEYQESDQPIDQQSDHKQEYSISTKGVFKVKGESVRGENGYSPEFLQFWEKYPKKVDKMDAWKAWKQEKPDLEQVLTALDWQVNLPDWQKDGKQFVKYPAGYIRAHKWEDECPRYEKPKSLDELFGRKVEKHAN